MPTPVTAPIIGQKTTIGYGTPTPTPIARLKDGIKFPTVKSSDVEVTSYSDTFEVFIPGWVNNGEFTIPMWFESVQYGTILGLAQAQTIEPWTLTLPDGGTLVFSGYINDLSGAIPMKEGMTADAKIRLTSAIVYTVA